MGERRCEIEKDILVFFIDDKNGENCESGFGIRGQKSRVLLWNVIFEMFVGYIEELLRRKLGLFGLEIEIWGLLVQREEDKLFRKK